MTIQEGTTCAAAGLLSLGGVCSHLISPVTSTLSFGETIDFIEAQPARTCVPVPGFNVCADDQTSGQKVALPARGAAIIMSADDWGAMKTELETACRELGSSCSYQTMETLKRMR